MSIADNPGKRERSLSFAYSLAEMGVPVFCAQLDAKGNPKTIKAYGRRGDRRWKGWDKTRPGEQSFRNLRGYRDGDAVCAVGGVVLDWLDWDPRSDPDRKGWEWLKSALDGVKIVTRSRTPSGGWHAGIPSLDLPKGKIGPGVDYQAGLADGASRGFVFIPPTRRISKADGVVRGYEAEVCGKPSSRNLDGLRAAIETAQATYRIRRSSGRRLKTSELWDICLRARKGEQRDALLAIILEWQRQGLDKFIIFNLFVQLASEMPCYDPADPWAPKEDPERYFHELLKPGVYPDAKPGEADGFSLNVSAGDEYISAADIAEEEVTWLNEPFLPFGCIVIMDGDPGQGKSVITAGMVARVSIGKPALPFGNTMINESISCGMIGAEDDIGQAVIGRLRAAGYDGNRNVWFMKLRRDGNGKIEILTFPHGTERVREFIVANELRLLIIDPISAFIGENIHTHNEASVRAALGPVADIARETGCCVVLVRHLNKDGSMKALYRGTGSIAFSALARSGIITGVCPDDGSFGLAQVKCSYARRFDGVVRYAVKEWEDNEAIPVVKWGEWDQGLTADELAKGPSTRKGPEPESQNAIRGILEPMFREKDTWHQQECESRIVEAGLSLHPRTIGKVKQDMGIESVVNRLKDGRVKGWNWTTRKRRASGAF